MGEKIFFLGDQSFLQESPTENVSMNTYVLAILNLSKYSIKHKKGYFQYSGNQQIFKFLCFSPVILIGLKLISHANYFSMFQLMAIMLFVLDYLIPLIRLSLTSKPNYTHENPMINMC